MNLKEKGREALGEIDGNQMFYSYDSCVKSVEDFNKDFEKELTVAEVSERESQYSFMFFKNIFCVPKVCDLGNGTTIQYYLYDITNLDGVTKHKEKPKVTKKENFLVYSFHKSSFLFSDSGNWTICV